VELVAPPSEIVRNPLELKVLASKPATQDIFAATAEAQPRRVKLDLLRDEPGPTCSVCAQPKEVEFGPADHDQAKRITLFLDHGKDLKQGQTVRLQMRDAENEAEDLAPNVSFTVATDI
jgi:hypothetical protein